MNYNRCIYIKIILFNANDKQHNSDRHTSNNENYDNTQGYVMYSINEKVKKTYMRHSKLSLGSCLAFSYFWPDSSLADKQLISCL